MPKIPRANTRRERAAVIDGLLLQAALDEIRDSGPDELNLSAVARRAGVTTGALYARYENANELVLAAWSSHCSTPLRDFISHAASMARGNNKAAVVVRDTLASRPAGITAGIAALIAAPRIDELEETVIPEFSGFLRDLLVTGALSDAALLPVAYALGAACFDAIIGAPVRDWVSPLAWIASDDARPIAHDSPPHADVPDANEIPFTIATGDRLRDELLIGAVSVIARSGLRRSSTSRIARASGHTQSALFQTWKTRRDLVSDVAGFISESFAAASRPFGGAAIAGDGVMAAEGIARLLAPASHSQRRVRLEFTLAAMYDRDVADRVNAADRIATDALMNFAPHAVALIDSIRAVVLGLILLEEIMGGLDTIHFEPLIQPLLDRARA